MLIPKLSLMNWKPSFLIIPCVICLTVQPVLGQWVFQGPGPIRNGQVEGIPTRHVTGAVECITPHPTNPDILYVGGVNGGVWKTANATDPEPVWEFVSEGLSSLSIGALEFDPTDPSFQTLVVANAYKSSLGNWRGGGRLSIFKTIDGGTTWNTADLNGEFIMREFTGVAVRGEVIIATLGSFGLWRTTDNGNTWYNLAGRDSTGLQQGRYFDLVSDPINHNILYTVVNSGVYKSADTGETWVKVSNSLIDNKLASATNADLAAGWASNLFVGTVSPNDQLDGLFFSSNGGQNWFILDIPQTIENGTPIGIHPGRQGDKHFSLAADRSNHDIVYVGGDRQDSLGVSSIGATRFTGRLFKVNASQPLGSQATAITHSGAMGNSAPHADSRDMDVDAAGNLIEGDDGGVYKRLDPNSQFGAWFSLNNNLSLSEVHNVDWDALSNTAIAGLQDNGCIIQETAGNTTWKAVVGGDGGDVVVDDSDPVQSVRYFSSTNFARFAYRRYNAAGNYISGSEFSPELLNWATGISIKVTDPFPLVTPLKLNTVNPERLLVRSNAGILYESFDMGTTVWPIHTPVGSGNGFETLAYGAENNSNAIYATFFDSLYVRRSRLSGFETAAGYAGTLIMALTINPEDAAQAIVIDSTRVFETTNYGDNFRNIAAGSGGLNPFFVGNLRSVAFINRDEGDMVAVGTDRGVYVSDAPDFDTWEELGTNLPIVRIDELVYDAQDDILVAATFGRGVWTYRFEEELDVDIALVLDFSQSMLQDGCPGCVPKLDMQKKASEVFLQIWDRLAIGADKISAVYFGSEVSQFTGSGAGSNSTVEMINDINSRNTFQGQQSALGAGLQTAILELDDPGSNKHIVLFTDGFQNVDPGVRLSDMKIVDNLFGVPSNVQAANPEIDLNELDNIRIHTLGAQATPAFENLLNEISTATNGLLQTTVRPDTDLMKDYIEILVEILSETGIQLVDYRWGNVFGLQIEQFSLDPNTNEVLFKLSYPRGEHVTPRFFKGSVDVTQYATVRTGNFYKIYHFTEASLIAFSSGQTVGPWSVHLSKGGQPTDYQLAVLAKEREYDYGVSFSGDVYEAGQPIKTQLTFEVSGEPWKAERMTVISKIRYPHLSIGQLLAETKLPTELELLFEKGSPIGEKKWTYLARSGELQKKIWPKTDTITLKSDGSGTFSGTFENTKIPGTYEFEFFIQEEGEGPLSNTQVISRTMLVDFGSLDQEASKIKFEPSQDNLYQLSFKPVDKLGNVLGPDHLELFRFKLVDAIITKQIDQGDGNYRFEIKPTSESASFTFFYKDKRWFQKDLK